MNQKDVSRTEVPCGQTEQLHQVETKGWRPKDNGKGNAKNYKQRGGEQKEEGKRGEGGKLTNV